MTLPQVAKEVFVVGWFSPRGFSNEGTYFYGTLQQWREFLNLADNENARWFTVSRHKTLEAAKDRAEKEVRTSKRRSQWGEQNFANAENLANISLSEF